MSIIKKEFKAQQVVEGAGVIVNRVFGYFDTEYFDPFLMMDYFRVPDDTSSPGFPWHPHKGIETITYMIKGVSTHEDSIGNKGEIRAGELQWMSAGKGIYHQEMPGSTSEGAEGFQLWLNLPAKDKFKEPEYLYIRDGEMKSVRTEKSELRVISGSYGDIKGPIDKDNLAVQLYHVTLKEGEVLTLHVPEDSQGFLFPFKGKLVVDQEILNNRSAYTLSSGEISLKGEGADFLFATGRPLKEPIEWHGPIVMNTKEEIEQTLRDMKYGTFVAPNS